eukprot:2990474-Rhodomonas_salina.1
MALQGSVTAVSVARAVMERCPHNVCHTPYAKRHSRIAIPVARHTPYANRHAPYVIRDRQPPRNQTQESAFLVPIVLGLCSL